MRIVTLTIMLITINLIDSVAQNQNNMTDQIKETVISIEKAAATRDVDQLAQLLHSDYRVIANRFKGTEKAVSISKETYLQMMKDQKIGGTNYKINFNDVKVSGHTAIVDLLYISDESSDMHKFLVFVQDENNQWKVVSDIPIIIE